MANKSDTALRTISEAADALNMPQHVLRFWETKFSQIKPMKRAGGRRYYRPDDVDLLRGIQYFLHVQGYTIKGLQKLIRDNGVRQVQDTGRDLRAGRLVSGVPESVAGPATVAATSGQGQLEFGGLSNSQKASLSKSLKELTKLRDELRKAVDS